MTSQCQNTVSPGLTLGTETMHSSNRRCGCDSGVGLRLEYPPLIPGKSGVEISVIILMYRLRYCQCSTIMCQDLPNFQLLASYISFEFEGTVGLKNGLKMVYAFASRTSG